MYMSYILDYKIHEGKYQLFHRIKFLDYLVIMTKLIQPYI